jgi:hypothetical protein
MPRTRGKNILLLQEIEPEILRHPTRSLGTIKDKVVPVIKHYTMKAYEGMDV